MVKETTTFLIPEAEMGLAGPQGIIDLSKSKLEDWVFRDLMLQSKRINADQAKHYGIANLVI